jgi:hypothetical protein
MMGWGWGGNLRFVWQSRGAVVRAVGALRTRMPRSLFFCLIVGKRV